MDTNCNANSGDAMKLLNFRVEEAQFERFREIAAAGHRTVSQELRHLMDQRIAGAETPEQRHQRELHDGTLTMVPPEGDPRDGREEQAA